MKKLLLHICCAPCSTSVIEDLKKHYELSALFYNPNIHPLKELELRQQEAFQYCKKLGITLFSEKSDIKAWFIMVKENQWASEKDGKRCMSCYEDRLKITANIAKHNNFDIFTTTLTISPHKHATLINTIGNRLGDEYGIEYLEGNFKKNDGFKRSVEHSKNEGMYRQDYCGCVYSKLERLRIKPYN